MVVDRLVGLYALLLLATGVILASGPREMTPAIDHTHPRDRYRHRFGRYRHTHGLHPRLHQRSVVRVPDRITADRHDAGTADHGRAAFIARRWSTLVVAVLMSLVTHTLFAPCLAADRHALFEQVPTLREHLIHGPAEHGGRSAAVHTSGLWRV